LGRLRKLRIMKTQTWIKDIDFKLRNDSSKVRQLLTSSSAVSYKDLTMLKLILTSGLYPQLAVADEHNSYKSGTDQVFHTRVKPFNVLHPNSIYASQPDVLMLDSLNIVNVPGFTAKNPASSAHQDASSSKPSTLLSQY